MKGDIRKLAKTEWDFRQLIPKRPTPEQRQELNAAIHYEYARESPSIRKLAADFAGLPKGVRRDVEEEFSLRGRTTETSPEPGIPRLSRFEILPYWNCVLWPKFFPDTPWLNIPTDERTARVHRYVVKWGERVLVKLSDGDAADGGDLRWEGPRSEGPRQRARYFTGTFERVTLLVNWEAGNTGDILEAIKKLLRRPKWIREPRGVGSREQVISSKLTRLGAMRLLNQHSYSKADKEAQGAEIPMPDQFNAPKLREQVRMEMQGMFRACHAH